MSRVSTVVMFLRLLVAICIDFPYSYTKLGVGLGIMCIIFSYFVHLYRRIFITNMLFFMFYRPKVKKLYVTFVAKNVKPKLKQGWYKRA